MAKHRVNKSAVSGLVRLESASEAQPEDDVSADGFAQEAEVGALPVG